MNQELITQLESSVEFLDHRVKTERNPEVLRKLNIERQQAHIQLVRLTK